MIEVVNDYVKKYNMIQQKDRIVVGVSGGADSVCLLFMMLELKKLYELSMVVVHVNHGIREKTAKEDEQFVQKLCEKKNIPYEIVSVDVKRFAKETGTSEEEAGRILRYKAFERVYEEKQCNKIAIAHNMNDQAETVLFHLFRGTGMKGLSGIRPVRGHIIRPILCLTRSQIEQCLSENHMEYQTDETNFLDTYTRNKIRLNILPYINQEINKKSVEHISQCANMVSEVESYLEKNTLLCFDKIVLWKNGQYCFNVEEYKKEDIVIQKRLIRFIIKKLVTQLKDVDEKHILLIGDLVYKGVGKSVDLPYGVRAHRHYEEIQIGIKTETSLNGMEPMEVHIPGEYELEWLNQNIRFRVMDYKKNMIIPKNRCTKWFDYDKIKNTIFIRNRSQGDYLVVDEKGSKKKLKSFFVDQKIPREERSLIPLLCDNHHVIWIIGERISEAYKVSDQTNRILIAEIYGGKHDR